MSEVLALKYRPKKFEDVIGQSAIIQTLSLALNSNRLSHAYLFSGLRGSGKTSTARIFAKALICEEGASASPCDTCSNCVSANENRHIDIIEMDAASNRKIDDIRELIEHTKYKPNTARFKVFIIDEVHMLTREAFNALLKTLEEPPPYVKFILATTDPLKLPATILSRTQHFRFRKISNNDVVHHLTHILSLENIEADPLALEMITRSGNGSLRDTLTLLDQAIIYSKGYIDVTSTATMLGVVDPSYLETIFQRIFEKDKHALMDIVKELENYESETVIDGLIGYVKDRFFENTPKFSSLITERFFKILSDAKSQLFLNSDTSFVLTMLLFKMIEALKLKEIDDIIHELESTSPEPVIAKTTAPSPAPVVVTTAPEPIPVKSIEKEISPAIEKEVSEPVLTQQTPSIDYTKHFETLKAKLFDRNYELGECFSHSVTFISYTEHTLTWESCAQDDCKNLLRTSYSIIKQFVKDIYGIDANIAMQACSQTVQSTEETLKKKPEPLLDKQEEIPTEDSPSSCIGKQVQEGVKDYEAKEMLESPMLQKAQELFNPKQIIVKTKV